MKLDSVRELKAGLIESVVVPLSSSHVIRSAGLRAGPVSGLAAKPPSIALGVGRRAKGDYVLAVRLQKRALEKSGHVESIRKKAKGEVDVRYIGSVVKRAVAPPSRQRRTRPMKIGISIGHFKITAGTLGGFVRDRKDGTVYVLSNNHVLADENRGKKGDAILQPGVFDGGANPADKVGSLARFVRLKKIGANLVDCAVATIDVGTDFDPKALVGIGDLAGLGPDFVDEGEELRKVGRTTGLTKGTVTAFELDNLMVQYDLGTLRFDNQMEIEGTGSGPFSQGGDSGSLIVDGRRLAVAQLFAGGDIGGHNGQGLTYVTPLHAVLDKLKVDLHIG